MNHVVLGLGRVPGSWQVVPARRLLVLQRREPRGEGVVTAFRDGTVTLRARRRLEGYTEALKEIGYQGVREGDLVVHSMDGFAGAIGVSDSDGRMSPVANIYRTMEDPRFLAYALRTMALNGFVASLAKGIRERSTSLDHSTVSSISLPVPPREEQRRIADFLDERVALIDQIIAAKRAITREISSLRTAMVEKDLSAEPLTAPLRRLLADVRTGSTPPPEAEDAHGLPWFTPGSFDEDLGLGEPTRHVDAAQAARFEAGSILMIGIGATAGRVAFLDHVASGNQQLTALKPEPSVADSRYLLHVLEGLGTRLRKSAAASTLPIINNETIRAASVPTPVVSRQRELADRWDVMLLAHHRTASAESRSVEILQEYKQSLITAAVTGELDVTTASTRIPGE